MRATKSIIFSLILIIVVLGLSISFQNLLAAWVSPSVAPPDGNAPKPLNEGSDNQPKNGMLLLNHDGNTNGLIVEHGNVGIGTVSPSQILDVAGHMALLGNINQSGTYPQMDINPYSKIRIGRSTNNAGFGVGIYKGDNSTTQNHWFAGNGNSYLAGNNGNVGIGTMGPNAKLWVSTGASGQITPSANADELVVEGSNHSGITVLTPNTMVGSLRFGDPENNASGIVRYNHVTDDMSFWTAGSQQATILNNGNVGIGDTTPSYKLDVNGDINFTGILRQNGTPVSMGSGTSQWTTSGTSIYYNTGNVGIGTEAPTGKFHVVGGNALFYANTSGQSPYTQINGNAIRGYVGGVMTGGDITVDGGTSGNVLLNSVSTGRVGIRTAAPGYPLHASDDNSTAIVNIDNEGDALWTGIRLERWNNEQWFIGMDTSGLGLHFRRGGSLDDLVIRGDTGNVGIGTAAPTGKLQVVGGDALFYANTSGQSPYTKINGNAIRGYVGGVMTGGDITVDGGTSGNVLLNSLSTGRVGIRTAAPGYPLQVDDENSTAIVNINNTGTNLWTGLRISRDGSERWFAGIDAASNSLLFRRAGSTNDLVIRYDTGNVGIGTDNPANKLDVVGGTFSVNSGTPVPSWTKIVNNTITGGIDGTMTGGNLALRGGTTGDIILNSNGSGNVGIGTEAPGYDLDVNGDINFTGTLRQNGTPVSMGSGTSQWTTAGTSIYYNTGNVGVGTTAPTGKLHVVGGDALFYANTSGQSPYTKINGNAIRGYVGGVMTGGDITVDGGTSGNVLLNSVSTGRVGIRTAAPGYPLQVDDENSTAIVNINNTGTNLWTGLRISRDGSERWFTGIDAASNSLLFRRAGSTNDLVIRYDTGNVGIGTDNPANKLDVVGGTFSVNSGTPVPSWTKIVNNIITGGIDGTGTGGNLELRGGTTGDIILNSNGSGNVGIGTEAPTERLTISGNTPRLLLQRTTGNPEVQLADGSGHWGIYNAVGDSNKLKFWYGSDLVTLVTNGNVGIGLENPEAKLHIGGGDLLLNNGRDIRFKAGLVNGSWRALALNNSDTLMIYENKMVIENGGNVGIGDTSPSYKLDVNGDINFTGTLRQNGTPVSMGGSQWTTAGTSIYYNTGNVGIGTAAPTGKLHVVGGDALFYANTSGQSPYTKINGNAIRGYVGGAMTGGDITVDGGTSGNVLLNSVSTGRVGIRTAAPGYPLQVDDENSTAIVNINNTGTNLWTGLRISRDGSERWFAGIDAASNSLLFRRAGSTNDLVIRYDTGNVGIGTDNPGTNRLKVSGGSFEVNSATPIPSWTKIVNNTITGGIDGTGTGGNLVLRGGTTGDIILNSNGSGNVGIGTEAPGYDLDVNGDINFTGTLRQNGTPVSMGGSQWTTAGTSIYYNTGNVGIGTTNPTEKLHVMGDIKAQINADAGVVHFGDTSDQTKVVGYDDSGGSFLAFYTNSVAQMRITANGNVGIGTTNPGAKLDVTGDVKWTGSLTGGSVPWARVTGTANVVDTGMIIDGTVATADIANQAIDYSKIGDGQVNTLKITDNAISIAKMQDNSIGSAEIVNGSIDNADIKDNTILIGAKTTGTLGLARGGTGATTAEAARNYLNAPKEASCAAGNYLSSVLYNTKVCGNPSDLNLKKDIEQLDNALDSMLQLRGVSFKWKDPEKINGTADTQMGMIAQEVEKVFPQWVINNPSVGYKTIGTVGFEGLTIEAIRELKEEIDGLKEENEILKKKVESLGE
ncbi:MAG: tail fiber domain-containing protein [Patescibacteria group bacterium]